MIPVNAGSAGLMGCNDKTAVGSKPVTPTVVIVVDNSSSMFEPRDMLWDPLFNALMDRASGVVYPMQDKVRFGFASYKGVSPGKPEGDPACATITKVPIGINNYDSIYDVYSDLGTVPLGKWETPTAHALNVVIKDLQADVQDPPGPKFILLVTDGDPDTCAVPNQQCGQDLSIKAVQDAKAAGIGTLVIGVGDIIGPGCDTNATRCGQQHLQDLANAGQGLPVEPPPASYQYQQCVAQAGGALKSTYAEKAGGGAAQFFAAKGPAELKTALSGLLNGVASCTFDLDATVSGEPSFGTVLLGSQRLTYNDPNGWRLDNMHQVTIQGAACDLFKVSGDPIAISFPCEQVVPR